MKKISKIQFEILIYSMNRITNHPDRYDRFSQFSVTMIQFRLNSDFDQKYLSHISFKLKVNRSAGGAF